MIDDELAAEIEEFARRESRRYLDQAKTTYAERALGKSARAKAKLDARIARLRWTSDEARDAQSDMAQFVADHVEELVKRGTDPRDAFEDAKRALSAEAEPLEDASARWWLEAQGDPAAASAAGMALAGVTLVAMAGGAILGFALGGGRSGFLAGGWIDTLVGFGVGTLIGAGLGLVLHGLMSRPRR